MPVIGTENGFVTHINVFSVDPSRQQELVELLIETVKAAQNLEGWVSASVHRAHDGQKVTNYVQYESPEAARRVTAELMRLGYIQRNVAMGRVDPGEYEVAFTLDRR